MALVNKYLTRVIIFFSLFFRKRIFLLKKFLWFILYPYIPKKAWGFGDSFVFPWKWLETVIYTLLRFNFRCMYMCSEIKIVTTPCISATNKPTYIVISKYQPTPLSFTYTYQQGKCFLVSNMQNHIKFSSDLYR